MDEFMAGHYDRVDIIYTHYVSTISQKPTIKRVMPLGKEMLETIMDTRKPTDVPSASLTLDYLFEPSEKVVLAQLLPRLVEMQIYQSLLEAIASEHSARMMAMKNASDAAADIIDDLTLTFNQARQGAITQEIAEISAGVAALEAS
jgi:F-type H+-transporting ATPase subunit gamma